MQTRKVTLVVILLLLLVLLGSSAAALAQAESGYLLVHPGVAQPAGGGYVLLHTDVRAQPSGTGTQCCCNYIPCIRR